MYTIKVLAEDRKNVHVKVHGSTFYEDLDHLKSINGSEWDDDNKTFYFNAKYFLEEEVLAHLREGSATTITRSTLKSIKDMVENLSDSIPLDIEYDESLTLYPPWKAFQRDGIKKLLTRSSMYNGDECGLGKTYEMVAVLNHLIHNKVSDDKILIITESEAIFNWKDDLIRFSPYYTEDDILIASKNLRDPFSHDTKIILLTYRTLLLVTDFYGSLQGKKRGTTYRKNVIPVKDWLGDCKGVFILDEAHNIKSHKSKAFKFVKLIEEFFPFRYGLSGTPFPNSIVELWSQMRIVDKYVLGEDFWRFVHTVAEVGDKYSEWSIGKVYPEKARKVLEKIEPFFIRRFKKDVLPDMAKHNTKIVKVPFIEKHKTLYQELIRTTLKKIREEKGRLNFDVVFNEFPYLMLVLSDPSIIDENTFDPLANNYLYNCLKKWSFKYNSKLPFCEDIIKKHKESKIIVWSEHPVTLNLLQNHFDKDKTKSIVLHGRIKAKDRMEHKHEQIARFRTDPEMKYAFLHPKVAGTGVNIPESDVAIRWDRSYSLSRELQSKDRNHRITSKKDVTMYILLLYKSIEMYQHYRLEQKVSLNNDFFRKDSLTKEEWEGLFSGDEKTYKEFLTGGF